VSIGEAVISLESYKKRFLQHISTRINLGGDTGNNLTLSHYFPLENRTRLVSFPNTNSNGGRKSCYLCKQQLSWKPHVQSQSSFSNNIQLDYYSFDLGMLLQQNFEQKMALTVFSRLI
jgi:hypothetical protein